jgi:hypothetical protein
MSNDLSSIGRLGIFGAYLFLVKGSISRKRYSWDVRKISTMSVSSFARELRKQHVYLVSKIVL